MFDVDHVSFSVKELDKSIEFYEVFGFEVIKRYESDTKDLRLVLMKSKSNMYIDLFNYTNPKDIPNSALNLETDLPVIGTKHMGLRVKDIEAAKDFVLEKNLATEITINEGRLGRKYFFVQDPNGILIEIIEEKCQSIE